MATPFDFVITNLKDLGFFQFLLPFMMSSAIFYGFFRKSKVFGDPERNVGVNAVVSLGASFMVWAAPILLGIDISTNLSLFFLQGFSAVLLFSIVAVIATMFLGEDLPEQLSKRFKGSPAWFSVFLIAGIIFAIIIFLSSGLVGIFFGGTGGTGGAGGTGGLSSDVTSMAFTIIILVVLLGSVAFIAR